MSGKTRFEPRIALLLSVLLSLCAFSTGAAGGEEGVQAAGQAPAAESHPADQVSASRERGKLVMLAFPHQLSTFVRTNLELGPMPKFGPSNHFVGIDVEIMEGFAEYLGVELWVRRVSEPSYAALIPDLLAGQGDLIASSLSITEERKRQVDFSDPYYLNYSVVVTPVGSSIESVADLRGKPVAVLPGSSHDELLRRMGVTRDWFVNVSFRAECYFTVDEGQADYTVVDANSAKHVLPTMRGLKVAFRLPDDDYYGFAVPPGSNLLEPLNRYLESIRKSGRLAEIIKRHEVAANTLAAGSKPAVD